MKKETYQIIFVYAIFILYGFVSMKLYNDNPFMREEKQLAYQELMNIKKPPESEVLLEGAAVRGMTPTAASKLVIKNGKSQEEYMRFYRYEAEKSGWTYDRTASFKGRNPQKADYYKKGNWRMIIEYGMELKVLNEKKMFIDVGLERRD